MMSQVTLAHKGAATDVTNPGLDVHVDLVMRAYILRESTLIFAQRAAI